MLMQYLSFQINIIIFLEEVNIKNKEIMKIEWKQSELDTKHHMTLKFLFRQFEAGY